MNKFIFILSEGFKNVWRHRSSALSSIFSIYLTLIVSGSLLIVSQNTNKPYYDLITKFKEKTGCPVIVNTSFNVRGEPIVNTPTDAFNCFMGTELDYLAIGNCILDKKKQDPKLKKDYTNQFELD